MEDLDKLSKKDLVQRLKDAESFNNSFNDDATREMESLEKIASNNDPNQIVVETKNDHKNIVLYTSLNKRVGPMHPDNAKRTMAIWRRQGVQLFVQKRTPEQVEEYKKTDKYVQANEKHLQIRSERRSKSKKGSMENFAKEIAVATGQALAKVNQPAPADAVK